MGKKQRRIEELEREVRELKRDIESRRRMEMIMIELEGDLKRSFAQVLLERNFLRNQISQLRKVREEFGS